MTVAPGMAGRIDAAFSGENRHATPKAIRNGPEFGKICIRFDDGFLGSRDFDEMCRERLLYFNRI